MPEIKLSFVEMGATVQPERGKLYLNTGNDLTPGVIDHHQLARETCTAMLVCEHRELYSDWLSDYDEVEIILHNQPNLDCIASLFIIDAIINERNIDEGMLKDLAEYTLEIDMGKTANPDIERPSLYLVLAARTQMLMDRFKKEGEAVKDDYGEDSNNQLREDIVNAGLQIITEFIEKIQSDEIHGFDGHGAQYGEGYFDEERKYLKGDYAKYIHDLENYRKVNFISVEIPLKHVGTSEKKKALIYRNPSPTLFKLWARQDEIHSDSGEGFQIMMVIWNVEDRNKKRYIMSTDPTGKYNLKFLGDVLNYYEKQKGANRGDLQEGENRPGYELPDPWYDGRSHNYTIVDTPHYGTILDEDEVVSLFSNFVVENIYLNLRVNHHRMSVIVPLKITHQKKYNEKELASKGFENIEVTESIKDYFRTSFLSLFFSNSQGIRLLTKRSKDPKTVSLLWGGSLQECQVIIEESILIKYENILLFSVQFSVDDDQYPIFHHVARHLNSLNLEGRSVEANRNKCPFLFDLIRDIGLEVELLDDEVYQYDSIVLDNFHFYRQPHFAEQIMNSFLSGEENSIARKPHNNEITKFTDYFYIGMNDNLYLSFQNTYDSQLSSDSVFYIFETEQRNHFFMYLFVVLRKIMLDVFSDTFNCIDLLARDRRTRNRTSALASEILNYINRLNIQYITNEGNGMNVFKQMLRVNSINDSFEEIFTSLKQLNDFNERRIQRKQSLQMELLQAIFLVGVIASVIALGAMPGAEILTYDQSGNLIGKSKFLAFSQLELFRYAPIVVVSALVVYLLIKVIFRLRSEE